MIPEITELQKKRAENIIWSCAGNYSFSPDFKAYDRDGIADLYWNCIIGAVRKHYDYPVLEGVLRGFQQYEESDIYNNRMIHTEEKGQCINCHSFQNYGTNNMLFHMRQFCGGTMFVHNGQLKKIDLKTDSTLSAGVYPAWHPTAALVAFSTNTTRQIFHTADRDKIEVLDYDSDLILYDVEKNEVSHISNIPDEHECFPTWSPDGKTLYYTSAHFDSIQFPRGEKSIPTNYDKLKYNISPWATTDASTYGIGMRISV